jgi:hypothetical protein
VEPKQRAIDALIEKYRGQLRLVPADTLPAPAYGFDPTGWPLFRVDVEANCLGGEEYVAIHPTTGKIQFLGRLGGWRSEFSTNAAEVFPPPGSQENFRHRIYA